MRKYAVVLVDVEGDQTTDGRDAVQRDTIEGVQEEPLVFYMKRLVKYPSSSRERSRF